MTLANEKYWLALWERRLAYRRRKYKIWSSRSPASETTRKWRSNVLEAEREVGSRRRRIQARQPKPTARQVAIRSAAKRIGITENPAGSNGNPLNISRWQSQFGFGRVPWCGIFCGTMMRLAGVQGVTSRIAGVALIEADAKMGKAPFYGWTTSASNVLPGDLVVIGGHGVHVEMVEKVLGPGNIQTIGGNTSSGPVGSQANGGGCFRRNRRGSEIRGFAQVNYPNR